MPKAQLRRSFVVFAAIVVHALRAANSTDHVVASSAVAQGCFEAEPELNGLASMSMLQVATERDSEVADPNDGDVPIVHVMYATTMNSTGLGDVGLMSSMLSLSQKLDKPHRAVIHLLVPKVDMALAMDFRACFHRQFGPAQKHPMLELHELLPLPFDPGDNPHTTYLSGNYPTYARWLAPEYLPHVSKLLYLDTDTLVQVDIRSLYETNLNTVMMLKPCGWVCKDETLKEHYKDFAVPADVEDLPVYSAGVMLADLDRWKAVNLTGALIDQANSLRAAGSYLDDQLILSAVAQRMHVLKDLPEFYNVEGPGWLPSDFDCMHAASQVEFTVLFKSAGILHFSGPSKQWNPKFQGCDLIRRFSPRTQCSSPSDK